MKVIVPLLVILSTAACTETEKIDAGADAGPPDVASSDVASSDVASSDVASPDVGSSDIESSDVGSDAGSIDAVADSGVDAGPVDQGTIPPELLLPADLTYQGAFRLPDEFGWGARGLSYHPNGASGAGSLFVTGPELLVGDGGELCSYEAVNNCRAYYGEVSLPTPTRESNWLDLPSATLLGSLRAFDGGLARNAHPQNTFINLFVAGIEYVPRRGSQTTDKLYGSFEEWYPEGDFGDASFETVWFSELDGSNARGLFHVGPASDALYHGRKMGDFLFTVPDWYANQYLGGRTLVTGMARGTAVDGAPGLFGAGATAGGSQGPTLFAFHPFSTENPSGDLDALPLLYYRVRYDTCASPDAGVDGTVLSCDFPGYTMCDLWSGGGFLANSTKSAIMLLGFKGRTNCYYCGDPIDDAHCPVADPQNWALDCNLYCNEGRGYHCGPYERQVLFYDPSALGQNATGTQDPWTILPYHIWRPTELYLQGQTCTNAGGVAFDATGQRVFMTERGLGPDNHAVVHVWRL